MNVYILLIFLPVVAWYSSVHCTRQAGNREGILTVLVTAVTLALA
jgi:hypothetical protein